MAKLQKKAHLAAIARTASGIPVHEPEDAARAVLEPAICTKPAVTESDTALVSLTPGLARTYMTLVAGDDHVFAPGMSFTVEPILHLPGEGLGVKLGDTVECTDDGPRSMTAMSHDLIVV